MGGTASARIELGYALPPGFYNVRAAIAQYDHPPAGGVIISYFLSALRGLTIVP